MRAELRKGEGAVHRRTEPVPGAMGGQLAARQGFPEAGLGRVPARGPGSAPAGEKRVQGFQVQICVFTDISRGLEFGGRKEISAL